MEIKRKDWVISGRTTSCKSYVPVSAPLRTIHHLLIAKGCQKGLSGTHFLSIKNGALRRKIAFNLTPEFLWELYGKQDGRCALTNLPLTLDCLIEIIM